VKEEAGASAGLFVWAVSFIARLENKAEGTRTREEHLISPAVGAAGNA
jgi:hypothetical protein